MATFDPDRLAKALEEAPQEFFENATKALKTRARRFLQADFPRARLAGRPGLNSGPGAPLRNSFDVAATGSSFDDWKMIEYTTSKYAAIHEHGGVIRPKAKQYLTVPLAAARTAAGGSRGSARDFADTYVARSKAGNIIIFQRAKGDEDTPLFVLRKQVTIPPRLGFFEAQQDEAEKRMEVLAKALDKTLDGLK